MEARQEVAEAVVAASNKTAGAGIATWFAGWATQVDWLGVSGVLVALTGLAISAYFQHRRDKREAAESEARVRLLEKEMREQESKDDE